MVQRCFARTVVRPSWHRDQGEIRGDVYQRRLRFLFVKKRNELFGQCEVSQVIGGPFLLDDAYIDRVDIAPICIAGQKLQTTGYCRGTKPLRRWMPELRITQSMS